MINHRAGPRVRAWNLPLGRAVFWAAILSVAMSTQFLLQPFVWRNFSLAEILAGWRDIVVANAIVTLPIALVLAAAGWAPIGGRRWRVAALAAAILVGVAAGGWLQGALAGAASIDLPQAGDLARWTVIWASVVAIYAVWEAGAAAAGEAEAAERRRSELQRLASQTELNVLQRQIEPHFLFNTLATVQGLYRIDADRGARLLAHLLQFMRSSMALPGDGRCSLGKELDLVRAYLGVCGARMGARLRVVVDVDPALHDREFPALALATLVENAIVHGIEPAPKGGELRVTGRLQDGRLEVRVEDDGVGFTGEGGSGIGLANTRARLAALYGQAAGLRLGGVAPHGFSAALWLPSRAAA